MNEEQAALAAAYLAHDDPLRQSGFSGGARRWERLRRPVADAVDRSGSFLDIGCANGVLLADVVRWCGERGVEVDPYGVDVAPELVALAVARLPEWRGQLFVGDAMTWAPPRRFDWVRTELLYVPHEQRRNLVARLLADLVAPSGALLVCWYGARRDSPPPADVAAELEAYGFEPQRVCEGVDVDGEVRTRVAVVRGLD